MGRKPVTARKGSRPDPGKTKKTKCASGALCFDAYLISPFLNKFMDVDFSPYGANNLLAIAKGVAPLRLV